MSMLFLLGVTILTGSDDAPAERRFVPLAEAVDRTGSDSPAMVELGRSLFFDPRLSGDDSMSCATCHDPAKAFGDGLATSKGSGGKPLERNAPTLLGVGLHEAFFWDGRVDTLEEQALAPIRSPEEMNQDLTELVADLKSDPEYSRQFEEAFAAEPSSEGIAKALAAYQRTLVPGPSPFDRYLAGDATALSDLAKEGFELFRGAAGCAECHWGPLLSDGKYYRLGFSSEDPGRQEVTEEEDDRFRFRTPSLRNVAQTGPYMHDGSMTSLFEVVEYYYRYVPQRDAAGLAPDLEPLTDRSFTEIPALVAFLESLTGPTAELRERNAHD